MNDSTSDLHWEFSFQKEKQKIIKKLKGYAEKNIHKRCFIRTDEVQHFDKMAYFLDLHPCETLHALEAYRISSGKKKQDFQALT